MIPFDLLTASFSKSSGPTATYEINMYLDNYLTSRDDKIVMFVTLLGGFLGSGKTTVLVKLAKAANVAGLKVAIIVNEAGEVGIDGKRIAMEGYEVVELAQGCICCSLAGTLRDTLIEVNREYKPDLFILEPTGLALPNQVDEIIRLSKIGPEKIVRIGIIDAFRYDILLKKRRDFIEKQLHGSDVIMVNKCDLVDDASIFKAKKELSIISPGAEIFATSALTGYGIDRVIKRMLS